VKAALVRVLVTLFWNGMLAMWYLGAAGSASADSHWTLSLMQCCILAFPLLHLAVGIGLTYWTAAFILNATTVSVDADGVRVSHGPMPTLAPRSWQSQARDIEQLLVRLHHGDRGVTLWKLIADVKGESLQDMFIGIQSLPLVEALESVLEELLGIIHDPSASDPV
jgi:hypothetical protein